MSARRTLTVSWSQARYEIHRNRKEHGTNEVGNLQSRTVGSPIGNKLRSTVDTAHNFKVEITHLHMIRRQLLTSEAI